MFAKNEVSSLAAMPLNAADERHPDHRQRRAQLVARGRASAEQQEPDGHPWLGEKVEQSAAARYGARACAATMMVHRSPTCP